jgi:hypothetical protein
MCYLNSDEDLLLISGGRDRASLECLCPLCLEKVEQWRLCRRRQR